MQCFGVLKLLLLQLPRTLPVHLYTLSDEGGLPFLIMYIFLYGILSYAVTIVIPILSCLYIRHRSILGDLKSQKALVRFTLFFVISNTISFIGQIVPVVITEALPEGDGTEEALLEDIVLTAEGWLVFFPSFQPLFSFYNIFSHFIKDLFHMYL